MKNPTIVIPARLGSGRVPEKVLIDIEGKTVLERVWEESTHAANRIKGRVIVAVEHERVADECKRIGAEFMFTKECSNGSERVAEVADAYGFYNGDWIINVQGDKVGVTADAIEHLYGTMNRGHDTYHTLYCMHEPLTENYEGIVKVIVNNKNEALYFTRKVLPHARKHCGIYGYTGAFLQRYISWGAGVFEQAEGLEQMRVLENGSMVKCSPCPIESGIAINTHDDIERAREHFRLNQDVKQVAVDAHVKSNVAVSA